MARSGILLLAATALVAITFQQGKRKRNTNNKINRSWKNRDEFQINSEDGRV
jgi:hypothetical protein